MKLSLAVLAVAVMVVGWPAVGASSPQVEWPRTQMYTDASSDSGSAADISTVAVTLDAEDALTFTVSEANRTALAATDSLAIFFDIDENSATGAPGGAEYQVVVSAGAARLSRWDGTAFVDVPAEELTSSFGNGKVTVHVRCEDIGVPDGINFALETSADGLVTVGDSAPDSSPWWTFALETAAKVTAGTPKLGKARAGGVLVASMPVSVSFASALRLPSASTSLLPSAVREEGATTCLATVAGKPVRVIRHSFSDDRASCAWRLPMSTRGKILRGRITANVDEASASRSFSVRVL